MNKMSFYYRDDEYRFKDKNVDWVHGLPHTSLNGKIVHIKDEQLYYDGKLRSVNKTDSVRRIIDGIVLNEELVAYAKKDKLIYNGAIMSNQLLAVAGGAILSKSPEGEYFMDCDKCNIPTYVDFVIPYGRENHTKQVAYYYGDLFHVGRDTLPYQPIKYQDGDYLIAQLRCLSVIVYQGTPLEIVNVLDEPIDYVEHNERTVMIQYKSGRKQFGDYITTEGTLEHCNQKSARKL
jgi:hypothetical protein